jgi:hypothetical protein
MKEIARAAAAWTLRGNELYRSRVQILTPPPFSISFVLGLNEMDKSIRSLLAFAVAKSIKFGSCSADN